MVQIKTTLHVGDALAALDGFSDRLKSKALPRALNKVADQAKVQARLDDVRAAARGTQNVLPVMKEALRADATLGEVSDALRDVFGVYHPGR